MRTEHSQDNREDSALEREIEALLAVNPSPEFLARIRTRIANERVPSAWTRRWVFAVAGCGFAAACILLLLISRPHDAARTLAPSATVTKPDVVPAQNTRATVHRPPAVQARRTVRVAAKEPELIM